jgi:UDP-2-acetamido-3-amino-2,3-dideoxy-glucuronate N-acetyltransferase
MRSPLNPILSTLNPKLSTPNSQPSTPNPQPIPLTHHTAIIDTGARIGNGTCIWHFTHVMAGAEIGENCVLGQNVFVGNKVVIGNGVKVQNNVSLYEGVICEDEVFIGPSAVFTNVINPRSAIERKTEFKTTRIGKGASIGANATIICGIEIGNYAFIGAGAVVTKNVPAYALVTGNPAKQTGWMSEAGEKLDFNQRKAICKATGAEYLLEGKLVKKVER